MVKLSGFIFLILVGSISISFATDTDGVWTLAENVRPGEFGSDEGVGGNYKFSNDVIFDNPIKSDSNLNFVLGVGSGFYIKDSSGINRFLFNGSGDAYFSGDVSAEYVNIGATQGRFYAGVNLIATDSSTRSIDFSKNVGVAEEKWQINHEIGIRTLIIMVILRIVMLGF